MSFSFCSVEKANNKAINLPKVSSHQPGQGMNDSNPPSSPTFPTLLRSKKQADAIISSAKEQAAFLSAQDALSARERVQQQVQEHVNALRHRTSMPVRYQAAEALAVLGPNARSARSALETALLRDESVHVRKSIARALGDLGDIGAQRVLQQVLENDEDKFVRMRAQQALERLNSQISR